MPLEGHTSILGYTQKQEEIPSESKAAALEKLTIFQMTVVAVK